MITTKSTKSNASAGRVLASGPLEQGFESCWGQVLVFFPSASFFPLQKLIRFFSFQ